ncbi:MAG: phosphoenolpyruvate synthase [Patescibacteria group bacterium]
MKKSTEKYILWFKEIKKGSIAQVGGKGANLGEMVSFDIPVPDGFVVTAQAYFKFLKDNDLENSLDRILKKVDLDDPDTINKASQEIQKIILNGEMCDELAKDIMHAYAKLSGTFKQIPVAVRSSATAEDLPDASFAGQQETYLNVKGESNVVKRVKDCWASLFEPRAIFYRQTNGFDHLKVGIAVPIQKMVESFISGVMFTINPVTNQKNELIIEAIYGLGEYIVQGKITPDTYVVDKNGFEIIDRQIAKQVVQLIKAKSESKRATVPRSLQNKRKLTDKQIVELAKIGDDIQKHYYFPQDIEWAFYKNRFYIVQTRPITTIKEQEKTKGKDALKEKREPIAKGLGASPGIASGVVKKIESAKEIKKIEKGDILATDMTTPDFVPAMKKAAAIITAKGGLTSHAAIVSRELGVPCIVGISDFDKAIKNNDVITVNGTLGEIYKGGMNIKASKVFSSAQNSNLSSFKKNLKTATDIYVNLGEPDLAEQISKENVDGVGLLRAEFMMAQIGTHPKKIIKDKKQKEYIKKLTEGITQFCKSFHPRPVIYRASDFKTNEYKNLIGGKAFEPEEENPMLGYRGASRYINDERVFKMELEAIKNVRRKEKLNNLWMMIPFVRTPDELAKVKKIITSSGLSRSNSFKLFLMVEIPANVIRLEEFIKVGIDGISIGSNDLTMLTLGLDRDNSHIAHLFNELDPAVLWSLEKAITTAKKHKISASICGQAPSVYPDLVEKLVKWGITSISVSPDVIEQTRELVYMTEAKNLK